MVAVVCDGCSQGAHSEVGAQLMSRFILHKALQLLRRRPWDLSRDHERNKYLRLLLKDSNTYLDNVITGLAGDRLQTVQSMFLFTVLGAVITPEISFVFSQGDGVYQINQSYTSIDENNRPNYLGYALLPEVTSYTPEFTQRALIATEQLDLLILASDGADVLQARAGESLKDGSEVGLLRQFAEQQRYLMQQTAISRRLNVINVLNRKGYDDTSIVVIKREQADER
jgi:hypothetical protein